MWECSLDLCGGGIAEEQGSGVDWKAGAVIKVMDRLRPILEKIGSLRYINNAGSRLENVGT